MKNCLSWQRARSDDQIEARIQTILEAAAALLKTHDYGDISLAMIGKAAKFTRSNLYRYFQTKEEIFLTLLLHYSKIWQGEALQLLEQSVNSKDDFLNQWHALLMQHTPMLSLFHLMQAILERNIELTTLIEFKKALDELTVPVAEAFVNYQGFKTKDTAFKFIISHLVLASSIKTSETIPEERKRYLAELNLESFNAIQGDAFFESVQVLFLHYQKK